MQESARMCAGKGEMEYVGDVNAYLYFLFKFVGLKHMIQHIAVGC